MEKVGLRATLLILTLLILGLATFAGEQGYVHHQDTAAESTLASSKSYWRWYKKHHRHRRHSKHRKHRHRTASHIKPLLPSRENPVLLESPSAVPLPVARPSDLNPVAVGVTEATTCTACKVTMSPLHAHREVIKSVKPQVGGYTPFRQSGGKFIPKKCSGIVDQAGNVGPIGKLLQNEILKEYSEEFLNGRSLAPVCPNFSKMNKEEQLKAWTWFWMVLANEESTCEPNTYHAYQGWGTTIGWGLYAGEYFPLARLFRGAKCSGDISRLNVQVECALSTMVKTQFGRGQNVLSEDSYWGPIRMYKKKIKPNMSLYKPCFAAGAVRHETSK